MTTALRAQTVRAAAEKVTGKFGQRSKQNQCSKNFWFGLSLILVVVMMVIAAKGCRWVVAFMSSQDQRGEPYALSQWWFRIALELPVVFLFWFSVSRYRDERHLEEAYAFKQIVAGVLPDYLDVVEGDRKGEIIDSATKVLFSMPSAGKGDSKFNEALTSVKEISEIMSRMKGGP